MYVCLFLITVHFYSKGNFFIFSCLIIVHYAKSLSTLRLTTNDNKTISPHLPSYAYHFVSRHKHIILVPIFNDLIMHRNTKFHFSFLGRLIWNSFNYFMFNIHLPPLIFASVIMLEVFKCRTIQVSAFGEYIYIYEISVSKM